MSTCWRTNAITLKMCLLYWGHRIVDTVYPVESQRFHQRKTFADVEGTNDTQMAQFASYLEPVNFAFLTDLPGPTSRTTAVAKSHRTGRGLIC